MSQDTTLPAPLLWPTGCRTNRDYWCVWGGCRYARISRRLVDRNFDASRAGRGHRLARFLANSRQRKPPRMGEGFCANGLESFCGATRSSPGEPNPGDRRKPASRDEDLQGRLCRLKFMGIERRNERRKLEAWQSENFGSSGGRTTFQCWESASSAICSSQHTSRSVGRRKHRPLSNSSSTRTSASAKM